MPKAEVGSTKHLNNKMKSKGLQRLRWYCQVCERQMRDENGFKMHTQSESHVRQMLVIGEDPKKFISDYSRQFQRDFMQLLKTGHGEKQVQINHFYQEYIANKEHVHMNATKWSSLTEFAKHLGREGLCRVEENDKGIHVAWIDDSPDALRRKDAVRKKEMQDRGDEEREQRMIREQIKRAQKDAARKDSDVNADDEDGDDGQARALKREEGEKIKLSFGATTAPRTEPAVAANKEEAAANELSAAQPETAVAEKPSEKAPVAPVSLKMAAKPQPKNVFAAAKKNALAGATKKPSPFQQPKKMSEAERIMKEEMEKQKKRPASGLSFNMSNKKQRTD